MEVCGCCLMVEVNVDWKSRVVGVMWLNPLQRKDYPIEWQLLWTLGLAKPNDSDEMVKKNPLKYSSIKPIASIAIGFNGTATLDHYQDQYLLTLLTKFHHSYFSDSQYFYNVHSLSDKKSWRELSGIHVEYALPQDKLDPAKLAAHTRAEIIDIFSIGNPNTPTLWSRHEPPSVTITSGGANAGFRSLGAALEYLTTHPNETVWAMNWDAPARPMDEQMNENLVLLVLAGPGYKTERKELAWIGFPAVSHVGNFEAKQNLPTRTSQAWQAVLQGAARKSNKQTRDIGYVIHDANNSHQQSSSRLGPLAQAMTMELPDLDFLKQTFNTPALLGEMGAGSALTNVALAIAYANHLGKNVLVAGGGW